MPSSRPDDEDRRPCGHNGPSRYRYQVLATAGANAVVVLDHVAKRDRAPSAKGRRPGGKRKDRDAHDAFASSSCTTRAAAAQPHETFCVRIRRLMRAGKDESRPPTEL